MHLIVPWLLGLVAVIWRGEVSKDVELLVLRHGRGHRQPDQRVGDPASPNLAMELGIRMDSLRFLIRDRDT